MSNSSNPDFIKNVSKSARNNPIKKWSRDCNRKITKKGPI